MIRVSIGTAQVLGLANIKQVVFPTTAYLMLGEKCSNSCAFCTQSRDSKSENNLLSRVKWLEFSPDKILDRIIDKYQSRVIKRVCLQVLNYPEAAIDIENWVKKITKRCNLPISVSINCLNEDVLERFLRLGADTVAVSLDAATPALHYNIKGYDQDKTLKVLKNLALKYPLKIRTHLIIGLGETEEDMIKIIQKLTFLNIPVSLFAFTPVKGTSLESQSQPALTYYRRIQLAYFLIQKQVVPNFSFQNSKIIWPENLIRILSSLDYSEAFKTTGCEGCNRPFYNETPRADYLYNYPRDLSSTEIQKALGLVLN